MLNLKGNFISTGEKLLLWPEILMKLQRDRLPTPINIQISPTNACNLDCWFCSVKNRDQSLQLSIDDILLFINRLSIRGTLKAVEITGGGEPTIYPDIDYLISHLKEQKLSIGLITNGLELCDRLGQETLDKLTFIRISMNTLEDTGNIQIPKVKGPTLGFSYVWGKPNTDCELFLYKLVKLAKKYKIAYIRLVPNCLENVELVQDKLTAITDTWGSPVFYQNKIPRKPKYCYLGFVKPFLCSDGWVYPCNSVSLPPDANLDFPRNIAMFPMNMVMLWMNSMIGQGCIDPSKYNFCDSCRFARQNDILSTVLSKKFKHKEHV